MKLKYLTPLNIPAGKLGDCEIVREVKPPGTKMMLGNMRTVFFGQRTPKSVEYPIETTWHQLLIEDARMMSDWPIEQRQHDELLRGMRHRVLVGGLGLGYAATVLLKRKSVEQVTAVEINENVIELVAKHLHDPHKKLTVVHADLFDFYKDYQGPKFNYAFHDIWASDSQRTFFETVCPLYELSKGKLHRQPISWNESIMRGQMLHSIYNRLMFLKPEVTEHLKMPKGLDPWINDGTESPWHNWCVPWFQWWKEVEPLDHEAQKMATVYAGIYGSWDWEKKWQIATLNQKRLAKLIR